MGTGGVLGDIEEYGKGGGGGGVIGCTESKCKEKKCFGNDRLPTVVGIAEITSRIVRNCLDKRFG